jgi:hypothetical protein
MIKGQNGVWTVTIGPVQPEIYNYSFLVDGAKTIDLANPLTNTGAGVESSVVEIPGDPPRFDQVQEVPHGSINIHMYPSGVSKTQRGLYVYVPPDYYSQPAKRFPVLYIYNGGGGFEWEWARNGRAGVILDNLIAQKKAAPMIIVMPSNRPGTPAPGVILAPNVAPVARLAAYQSSSFSNANSARRLSRSWRAAIEPLKTARAARLRGFPVAAGLP